MDRVSRSFIAVCAVVSLLVAGAGASPAPAKNVNGCVIKVKTDCKNANLSRAKLAMFEIEANPNSDVPGMRFFSKYVEVFGLGIYAESGLTDSQVLHAAAILAELLDNNENGVVDDKALLAKLKRSKAIVPMFNSDRSKASKDFRRRNRTFASSAVLFAGEVDPKKPGYWGSDASVEEIMHIINQIGHRIVYPKAFGMQPNSSLLSDSMDVARGGKFRSTPRRYPKDAWYHYDDKTCEYACMATEYLYWAQVSNMGILNDKATCDGIANEWEPCSKQLLKRMDPLMYALITNPRYKLPQNAPDGKYGPYFKE